MLGSIAGTLWTGAVASSNLSDEGRARFGRFFMLGRLAGREYFTPRGWRYRNASLVCQLLILMFAFAWVRLAPNRWPSCEHRDQPSNDP